MRIAWEPERKLATTTRHWEFEDGRNATDVFARRIWSRDELRTLARGAGFSPLDHDRTGVTLLARPAD